LLAARVRWRLAYVPHGKSESARALPSRILCVLPHRRKRSHKLSGIDCVAATIQLTGREPATFDCPVDRRFGNACGPCCAAWCVHGALPMRCAKNLLLSFHAVVKARLNYAAEQRRKASIVIPSMVVEAGAIFQQPLSHQQLLAWIRRHRQRLPPHDGRQSAIL
jgi:hypothetical protein